MNFLSNVPDVQSGDEYFEIINETDSFIIERIVSNNAVSPADGWYDQDHDEWVMVMQGAAVIETHSGKTELHSGDTFFIPAGIKHKVIYTSANPVCIWLAVHQKN
jgi:cupin 2 domain-containing protein